MSAVSVNHVIEALALPSAARVALRVPKARLAENASATAADKRRLAEGIDRLLWVAALKPGTIGVAEYRDGVREYLEIAVLQATLRPATKPTRLLELIHRAIPYPVLLVAEFAQQVLVSAAHKRWSQGESGRVVLEDPSVAVTLDADYPSEADACFLAALALDRQPRQSLFALYHGWIDTLYALHAARRTGQFTSAASADAARDRATALAECARLESECARLRAAAEKATQMARQVELNLELKRIQAAHTAALNRL